MTSSDLTPLAPRWAVMRTDTRELLGGVISHNSMRMLNFGHTNPLTWGDYRTARDAYIRWLHDNGFIQRNISLAPAPGRARPSVWSLTNGPLPPVAIVEIVSAVRREVEFMLEGRPHNAPTE